jgi:hypothetical protein
LLAELSSDIGNVQIFGAEFDRHDGGSILNGVIRVEGVGDFRMHSPFHAELDWICEDRQPRTECWKVAVLNVGTGENQMVLVSNGEAVDLLSTFSPPFIGSGESGLEDAAAMAAASPTSLDRENLPDTTVELSPNDEDDTASASAPDSGITDQAAGQDATGQDATGQDATGKADEAGSLAIANLSPEEVVIETQKSLKALGYNPGVADGVLGPKTTSAILAYQRRHGLVTDGEPSVKLLEHLQKTIKAQPEQTSQLTENLR